MDGVYEAGVIPVLDDVVGTVVDLHLNGVPAIVDEEDNRVLLGSNHSGDILCCDLISSKNKVISRIP